MRFRLLVIFALVAIGSAHADPLPPEIDQALNVFRAEGTRGWGFTQTTATDKEQLVEHYNPSKPDYNRWTLLKKNGQPPNEAEKRDYADKLSRRGGGDTAPDVTKQLDRSTAKKLSDDPERSVYRFQLKPGGKDDSSAAFMTATFTYHKPTKTIEKIELGNSEPFSPMFAVRILEARTVINYRLPTATQPTLLDRITVHVRGRALLIRSLDEDMTVTYSDYKYVGQRFAEKLETAAP